MIVAPFICDTIPALAGDTASVVTSTASASVTVALVEVVGADDALLLQEQAQASMHAEEKIIAAFFTCLPNDKAVVVFIIFVFDFVYVIHGYEIEKCFTGCNGRGEAEKTRGQFSVLVLFIVNKFINP